MDFQWLEFSLFNYFITFNHFGCISSPKYLKTRIKIRIIITSGGKNGIPTEQYFKILKSPLTSFSNEIPKSPLKLNSLKRIQKSGEKRLVIFGGENGTPGRTALEKNFFPASIWSAVHLRPRRARPMMPDMFKTYLY